MFPELQDRVIIVLGLVATLVFLASQPHARTHVLAPHYPPSTHLALSAF